MRPGPASVLTLALLTALAGGVAAGSVLTDPGTPTVLATGSTLAEAPVTTRDYTDQRGLALRVSAGSVRSVTVRVGGYVTESTCVPGGTLDTGTSSFTLDGSPLLSLHTTVPLWRDLAVGDRGADVTSLHDGLRALGADVPTGDRVTAATLRAFHAARTAVGVPAPAAAGTPIDHTRVIWLPEPSVTVGRCLTETGSDVTAGDVLVELPATVDSATLVSLPTDGVPGARVLTIDEATVPVDGDGRVTDPAALAAVAASSAYAEASSGVEAGADVTLTVPWILVDAVPVWVVPPGSVLGAGSDLVCVRDGADRPVAVAVVGSELGQTFVTPIDAAGADSVEPPSTVRTRPTGGCA